MKLNFWLIGLPLLLTLQWCVPACAAQCAPERVGDAETAQAAGGSARAEDASPAPDGGVSDLSSVLTEWAAPQPGEYGLFQEGAFFGPQTLPGQAALLDVSEHPGYTPAERQLYQEIEAGLKDQAERFPITPFPLASQDRLTAIYYQVVNDHPELFYCRSGLRMVSYLGAIVEIAPMYLYSIAETEMMRAEFDRRVSDALAQVDGITDELEKVLILHDYLTVNCKYAQPIPAPPSPVYSAYGALVDQEAVCQGYALAFKLLMNEVHIPCVLIEGAETMNHVWNAVQLDGKWYHMDVTWDDPIPNGEGYSRHDYFLRSNAKMLAEGTGYGCHYGWDVSAVSPWGGAEYDSGWIFNDATAPIHRWNGSYYYMEAPFNNESYVYRSATLQISSTPPLLKALNRNGSCGSVWRDNGLYFIPYTPASTLNVVALDLDSRRTVQLDAFTRSGTENVGLREEESGIAVFRANTDIRLGSSLALPRLNMLGWNYGLSADGKYLAVSRGMGDKGKALWIASYDSKGKMKYIGSAPSFSPVTGAGGELRLLPLRSRGTPEESVKLFLLDPITFAP